MDNVVRIMFVEFVSGDTGFDIDFRAARVEIGLNMSCDNINFNISDNGIGITEHERKSKKSFGLISMKERTFSLGGTIDYAVRTAVVLFLNLFLF
jgi:signal transduction histidine kinase